MRYMLNALGLDLSTGYFNSLDLAAYSIVDDLNEKAIAAEGDFR